MFHNQILQRISYVLFVALLVTTVSCESEEEVQVRKGALSFSFALREDVSGRTNEIPTPASIYLTIEDASGYIVFENHKLGLISFGEGFVSENLEMGVGSYHITKFFVLNAENEAIYATPLSGSEKAPLVEDPLPISFMVEEGGNTYVKPQVLAIEDNENPDSFGYASFSFEIVEDDVITAQIKIERTVGELTYLDVATKVLITGYTIDNEAKWSKEFDYNGPEANVFVLKSGYDHYAFEVSHFGSYSKTVVSATDLIESSKGPVQGTYVLTGTSSAKKLLSQVNYTQKQNPTTPGSTFMEPSSKVTYEYDLLGNLSTMRIFGYNATLSVFEEQRYFNFLYDQGRVSKLVGFHPGEANAYLEDVYSYNVDGHVSKIVETNFGSGIDTEVSLAYLYTERLIKATYRLSNGTGFEYEIHSQFGNPLSDRTTRFGSLCNVGDYDYDKKINPRAHLGYMDLFLENYSYGNRLSESVSYTGCAFPTLIPDSYSYEYTQEGYPLLATTHYQGSDFVSETRYVYQ